MTKQTLKNVELPHIEPAKVHWFQSLQKDERGHSFGNPLQTFPESFADDGWDIGQGVPKAYELTSKEQDAAIEERKAQYEQWSKSNEEIVLFRTSARHGAESVTVKVKLSEVAEWAKANFWTHDNGKWIKPTHGGNSCFRRGYALPASMMAFLQKDDSREMFEIPLDIVDYGPPSDERLHRMHLDRLKENSQTGRKKYDAVDQLFNTFKLVKQGYGESDVMKILNEKRGMAQKLHGTALLARKFSDLNILDRCAMDPPKDKDGKTIDKPAYTPGGYIPFSRLKAATVRTLLGRATGPDKMDDIAARAMDHRDPNRPADEKQVEKAIELLFEEQTNAPKMMEKSHIQTLADGIHNGPVKDLLNAILQGNNAKAGRALDALDEQAKLAAASAQ